MAYLTDTKPRRKGRPVFYRLVLPLFLLLLVELLLLVGSLLLSDAGGALDRNARAMVDQQVINRRTYIENLMVKDWSDLSLLSQQIDGALERHLQAGTLALDELDSSSEAVAPLLIEISDQVVGMMYTKQVNGAFVLFNTHDLPENWADCPDKPGLYIRDLDPRASPSIDRADLLLERAPIAVVQQLNITADSTWQPMFRFTEQTAAFYDCLRQPYQAVRAAGATASSRDYGRWSAAPYMLSGDLRPRIAYVQPLMLPDGTVYGLIGIELMVSYLHSMLPDEELSDAGQGSYLLGVTEDGVFTPVAISGAAAQQYFALGDSLPLRDNGTGTGRVELGGRGYYVCSDAISTYNSNTPFLSEQWTLVGMVAEKPLYAMSARLYELLRIAIVIVLLAGLVGTVGISRRVSEPIRRLSREVSVAREHRLGIPQLSKTGITELDGFAQAFTALSREAVDSSTWFLRIMDMASVELGGFEMRLDHDDVFVTDNFFPMFGMTQVDTTGLDTARFRALLRQIRDTLPHTDQSATSTLYQIDRPGEETRYLHIEGVEVDERYIGVVEDVTTATKERIRIEHERDYDLLTGLLSRRAFYRQATALFRKPQELGHAALVMLDLDDLKKTNDRFGHDWGDKYIRLAGQCFASAVPKNTLCARISGDEFYLFFYGYPDQQSIRRQLDALTDTIRASDLRLPNGEHTRINVTGGVVWCPEDSTKLRALIKYADFAMYQTKRQNKGQLGEFDRAAYEQASRRNLQHRDFQRLVEEETLVNYHFQPIVSTKTGRVFAYEALMRVDMPALRDPGMVMEIARSEGRLSVVEYLTWNRSLNCYQELLDQELVDPTALLFVNSIASEVLDEDTLYLIHNRHSELQKRVVVELTESEFMDEAATKIKANSPGFSGMFALDDYGSGYNSELNLLALSPKFIKVDVTIIRDIDQNADKQKILENIVSYAHERDMMIVTEGVETAQEMDCVLRLGADLLQGYYLARPARVPGAISAEAAAQLLAFRQERGYTL